MVDLARHFSLEGSVRDAAVASVDARPKLEVSESDDRFEHSAGPDDAEADLDDASDCAQGPTEAFASAVEVEAAPQLQSDEKPISEPVLEPEPEEVVRYAAYDHRTYERAEGTFSSPPGFGAAQAPESPAVVASVTTSLPGPLLEEVLAELSDSRSMVEGALGVEPVVVSWPEPAGDENRFGLAAPDERFRGGAGEIRTLRDALAEGDAVDALDRLELVRLVGFSLQALHAAEIVTGGVDLGAYAFTTDPRPSVCLVRPERLRRIGSEQLVADSVSWGRQYDHDRFEFAVLAYQLLVSGVPDSEIRDVTDVLIPGLRPSQVRRLETLWDRSSQAPGTRPQISEWMEVLLP